MGWASGGELLDRVIIVIKPWLYEEGRREAYRAIVDAFQDFNCDVIEESLGLDPELDDIIAFDGLYQNIVNGYIFDQEEFDEALEFRLPFLKEKSVNILRDAWEMQRRKLE